MAILTQIMCLGRSLPENLTIQIRCQIDFNEDNRGSTLSWLHGDAREELVQAFCNLEKKFLKSPSRFLIQWRKVIKFLKSQLSFLTSITSFLFKILPFSFFIGCY
eukprot:GHVP01050958.1.p3 GENE.GHVP01050958.1~~GHVP01050958.1.p3  ORF type:complete len:105 (-),score=9.58 GHVP01050958.1:25-339(-)